MVQDTSPPPPAPRGARDRHISAHAATVAKDIAEAKRLYAPKASWTPESLAFYTQAVLQGAFILAKAKQDSAIAAESIAHLRDHVETLLTPSKSKQERTR